MSTDYKAPPVSPEDMDAIERRHESTDAEYAVLSDNTWARGNVWAAAAHDDRRRLLEQLDYTAAVVISLQLELVRLREML